MYSLMHGIPVPPARENKVVRPLEFYFRRTDKPHASEDVKKSSALRVSTIAYSPVPQERGFTFLKQFCFNHLWYLNPHPCGMGLWALFTISAEIRFFHTFSAWGCFRKLPNGPERTHGAFPVKPRHLAQKLGLR